MVKDKTKARPCNNKIDPKNGTIHSQHPLTSLQTKPQRMRFTERPEATKTDGPRTRHGTQILRQYTNNSGPRIQKPMDPAKDKEQVF